MLVTVELLYGTWGKRQRKENDRVISNIVKHKTCKDREYEGVY
jgi:hypothetical protein